MPQLSPTDTLLASTSPIRKETSDTMDSSSRWAAFGLGIALPLALIAVILGADAAEGPKTAYVGVLSVVPMLAAVFGSPLSTLIVGAVTWLAAFGLTHHQVKTLVERFGKEASRKFVHVMVSGWWLIAMAFFRRPAIAVIAMELEIVEDTADIKKNPSATGGSRCPCPKWKIPSPIKGKMR